MTITMISAPAFNYEPVVRNTGLLSKMFLVQVDSGRLYYRFVSVPTSCLRLRLQPHRGTGEVMERDPAQFERVPFEIAKAGTYELTIEVDTDNATLVGLSEPVNGFLYLAESEMNRDGTMTAAMGAEGTAPTKQLPQRITLRMRFVEPETLDGYLAIDIGTTNSTACVYDGAMHLRKRDACPDPDSIDYTTIDSGTTPVPVRTPTVVPTDLFVLNPNLLLDEESACVMGRRAQEMAQDPAKNLYDSCLIQGAKSVLASDEQYQVFFRDGAYDNNRYLTPTDVLAAVAKKLVRHAERSLRKRISRLILTYPPQWTFTEQNQLREIVQRLQPKDPKSNVKLSLAMDIDEASAAGLYYIYRQNNKPGAHSDFMQRISAYREEDPQAKEGDRYRFKTLTFDYGGGTLDLSLVEYVVDRRRVQIGSDAGNGSAGDDRWKTKFSIRLLDSDTLENHGGNAVTLNIFRLLKRKIALAIADWNQAARDLASASPQGPVRGLDRDRRAPVSGAIPALVSNWKAVLESIKPPPLVDSSEVESAIKGARSVVFGLSSGPMPVFPRDLGRDQEKAVEGVFRTAWSEYGDMEREVPRKNARRLWMLAEQLKTELTREFDRELMAAIGAGKGSGRDSGEITAAVFEQVLQKTQVSGLLDTEHFDSLKGLLPTADRESADLRKAVLGLTIHEVFHCTLPLLAEGLKRVRLMCEAYKGDGPLFQWVTLAGNASKSPLVRYLFLKLLGVDASQVQFDAEDAKMSVAKGACINRIIRGLIPDIEFETHAFATKLARPLELYFAGDPIPIFNAGPIVESESSRSFWTDELFGGNDDTKILQVLECFGEKRPVIQRFTFRINDSPPPGAAVLARCQDNPAICSVLQGLKLKELPDWSEVAQRTQAEQLESFIPGSSVTWSRLLKEMEKCDFRDRLSWYESAKRAPPPDKKSQIRFYLSRERSLYMVEHFADGRRLLYEGKPPKDEARRDVKKRENPFSGVH